MVTPVSNAPGFGMSPAIGHIDFYPNGGKEMPGCGKNPISQIVDLDGIWEGKCCLHYQFRGSPQSVASYLSLIQVFYIRFWCLQLWQLQTPVKLLKCSEHTTFPELIKK